MNNEKRFKKKKKYNYPIYIVDLGTHVYSLDRCPSLFDIVDNSFLDRKWSGQVQNIRFQKWYRLITFLGNIKAYLIILLAIYTSSQNVFYHFFDSGTLYFMKILNHNNLLTIKLLFTIIYLGCISISFYFTSSESNFSCINTRAKSNRR